QVTHAEGEVARREMFCDFHMTPGPVCIEEHEQIGCAIAPILAIIPLELTWCRRDWFAHLANQLGWAFVAANHWMRRIEFFGIKIENILHPGDIAAVDLRDAPHIPAPWLQIVLGQTSAHRLARQFFMYREPDHRAGQKIECPAFASLRRTGAG